MPVPSAITDLSTTAGSNSPAGTDPIGTDADNYIRAHAAFIAALRDGSKNLEAGTATAPSLAFTGDTNTGIYSSAADSVTIAAGGGLVANFSTSGTITFRAPATYIAHSFQIGTSAKGYIGTDNGGVISGGTGSGFGIRSEAELILMAGAADVWRIDSTGRLKNVGNTQPSFRATNSSSETGSTATFDTYTETYDQGSNFNHTTGAFVAPVAGVYLFVLDWQCSLSSSGQVEVQIYNSTTATTLAFGEFSLGSAAGILKQGAVVALARLAASDSVIARTGTVTNGTGYANSFSGHLLG